MCVQLVLNYADTQFSNFAVEYLRENKKVRKIVFACSYMVQVENFKQPKNWSNSRDTVPLTFGWKSSNILNKLKNVVCYLLKMELLPLGVSGVS